MSLRERLQPLIKTVLLVALGVFFYTRIANGTLYYYINERFAIFTVIGVVGLMLLGFSYRWQSPSGDNSSGDNDESHSEEAHAHGDQGHSHALTWGGIAIIALPIVLGLITKPQPLGAAALANRDITLSMNESALPIGLRTREKASTDKTIMDWWHDFRASSTGGAELVGQEVRVSGFVFRDERFGQEHILVTRFVVSCCVADANVLGLLIELPVAAKNGAETTTQQIADDQWIEVHGIFVDERVDGWHMPLVKASAVQLIEIPNQPYLYP